LNLFATQWPDREADAAVGKRTLAVRLAPAALRRLYAALALAAAVLVVVLWRAAILPDVVAAAHLLALPPLAWGGRTLTRRRSPLPAVLAMVTLAAVTTVAWWARALTG
jgi:1,4-dihydroxy-2-naphthoate octaprenyltransferase